MLRANISQGWQLHQLKELKLAADAESINLGYLFADAQKFIGKIITIFMDESYGRDNYMAFFKLVNTACPFLLMNDYRMSEANNSLRRVQML